MAPSPSPTDDPAALLAAPPCDPPPPPPLARCPFATPGPPGAAMKPSGDTRRGEDIAAPGFDELPVGVVLALLITRGRTPAGAGAPSDADADAAEDDDNRLGLLALALAADVVPLVLPDDVLGVADLAVEAAAAAADDEDVEVGVLAGRRFLALAVLAAAIDGDFASAAAAVAAGLEEGAPAEPGTKPFLRLLAAAAANDEVEADVDGELPLWTPGGGGGGVVEDEDGIDGALFAPPRAAVAATALARRCRLGDSGGLDRGPFPEDDSDAVFWDGKVRHRRRGTTQERGTRSIWGLPCAGRSTYVQRWGGSGTKYERNTRRRVQQQHCSNLHMCAKKNPTRHNTGNGCCLR